MNDRIVPRVSARLQIRFGFNHQQLLTDYSVNLSAGGVFIETAEALAVDTPLTLEFSFPDNPQPIHCRGRVAWVNRGEPLVCPNLPPGLGVQFLDLNLADLHALRSFIDKALLRPSW